jgi:hypothetical protein
MTRRSVKLLHEGQYAAEVQIDLIEQPDGWAPYISPADASKLDEVRRLLRMGDLSAASHLARVFELTPVSS